MSPTPLIEARDLVKDFGSTRVIHGVSLDITRGETLGLVGESGSGKSTIARLLLRLIEPTSGSVLFHDTGSVTPYTCDLLQLNSRDMRRLRRRLSIVFQDPYAALNPRMSVRQILSEPFAIHREQPPHGSGSHSKNLDARLHELLDEVGLDPSALRRYPHEFSGGQRQRINIARAIALRPELLVLDEPVSALDVSVGAQVINLLRDLQQRYGLTYLFISHSMPLVRYLCHRVAVMQHGRIVETGTWSEVCDSPREPYTQQLLAATPALPTFDRTRTS
ncbi:MAG TPA: ATP-binding cassette domain-containing protein [Acidobacteriaceae bacterium]|nr:ATP-binding cassette domain-containing protein [Acidobacteriaceae bacterium]